MNSNIKKEYFGLNLLKGKMSKNNKKLDFSDQSHVFQEKKFSVSFFEVEFFCPPGTLFGVVIFTWGRIWGFNLRRGDEICVLGAPKLQKTVPRFAKA